MHDVSNAGIKVPRTERKFSVSSLLGPFVNDISSTLILTN
jgi:hypothetical protein